MKQTLITGLIYAALASASGHALAEDKKASEGNPMVILKQVSQDLGSQKAMSMETTSVYDERFEDGLIKTIVTHRVDLIRPNSLYFDAVWADGERFVGSFDGEVLRFYEPAVKEYSEIPFKGTVSEMADFADAVGLTRTPLNDLMRDDFYSAIEKEIFDATLIEGYLDPDDPNRKTSHLLFESPGTSWQMWVKHGDLALPERYNVKYVRGLGQPEYAITFDRWSFQVDETALVDKYGIPRNLEGWTKVEFENPIKFGD